MTDHSYYLDSGMAIQVLAERDIEFERRLNHGCPHLMPQFRAHFLVAAARAAAQGTTGTTDAENLRAIDNLKSRLRPQTLKCPCEWCRQDREAGRYVSEGDIEMHRGFAEWATDLVDNLKLGTSDGKTEGSVEPR